MSEAKRYYWLKLPEDFFEDETILWLESQENGKDYCLFYLKLCVKALKKDGVLIRYVGELIIPYDLSSLSKLTNTPVDTVKIAIEFLRKIGLISVLETGEIIIEQFNELAGSETDKARLMREKRIKEKLKLTSG
ncbi:hypothetical protein Ami103574_04195 [Aminipila butyrica]|uniref:Phage replisome organiser N-terminal domain-containing protein n=1 Tax=Aminipila butyrica TaxID=433296 RepID=A0A858BRK8_9FIRM|nr:phage replisome organizer N-terminal domain-containing protein [Aminipila butyrica]QIB68571.1 hypothetical protein Ami103574_04195 [Aminipila butyrica]